MNLIDRINTEITEGYLRGIEYGKLEISPYLYDTLLKEYLTQYDVPPNDGTDEGMRKEKEDFESYLAMPIVISRQVIDYELIEESPDLEKEFPEWH